MCNSPGKSRPNVMSRSYDDPALNLFLVAGFSAPDADHAACLQTLPAVLERPLAGLWIALWIALVEMATPEAQAHRVRVGRYDLSWVGCGPKRLALPSAHRARSWPRPPAWMFFRFLGWALLYRSDDARRDRQAVLILSDLDALKLAGEQCPGLTVLHHLDGDKEDTRGSLLLDGNDGIAAPIRDVCPRGRVPSCPQWWTITIAAPDASRRASTARI